MASSLRGTIKYLRGIGKLTPQHTNRILKALDVVDDITKFNYLPDYDSNDGFAQGYNGLLHELKRKVGCKDES